MFRSPASLSPRRRGTEDEGGTKAAATAPQSPLTRRRLVRSGGPAGNEVPPTSCAGEFTEYGATDMSIMGRGESASWHVQDNACHYVRERLARRRLTFSTVCTAATLHPKAGCA